MANTADHSTQAMEDAQQSHFLKLLGLVFGFLVLFTFFCMFVARMLGASGVPGKDDPILRASLMDRISPVGNVRTSADAPAETVAAVAVVQSGEDIVNGVCAGCHIAGVANAPKLDDDAAWEQRRSAGLDTLLASVINGKGAMPARAGTSLSDEELRLAVQHMAGFPSDGAAAPAAGQDSDAAAETTQSEAPAAEATTTAAKLDDGSGFVAAELTDRIKGVADSVCIACHLSGVAGAPKIGDKEAWAERAEKGLEQQVAVVATGKGAMPARGGSDLTDEELGAAIEYLANK